VDLRLSVQGEGCPANKKGADLTTFEDARRARSPKLAAREKMTMRSRVMEIKVLGPGCARCDAVEKNVEEAVAEAGLNATILKVTDTMEIAKHGVFGTPAVIVDGEVKSVGKIPATEEIKGWLRKK
jgi:small redox-active disulfide protein 2